jgi:hypothetical protein
MLNDFFKLNGEPERYDTIEALLHHFKTANDIRDVLYIPDVWPSDLRRMTGTTFSNVSLSKKTISEVTFTGCTFEDCLFIGTNFVGVEFHRCKFVNCNFYKSSFDDCYLDPDTVHFDKKYRKSAANVGVALYHALIENASKRRQSDFEMNADMQFRRWKRWQLVFDEKAKKIGRAERYRRTAAEPRLRTYRRFWLQADALCDVYRWALHVRGGDKRTASSGRPEREWRRDSPF